MRSSILGHRGEDFSQQHAFHPRFARFRGYTAGRKRDGKDCRMRVPGISENLKTAKHFWMKKE
jgi:hypothetical protein